MEMRRTRQDPAWHGEGDVWAHTKLVCEELASNPAFRALPERQRQELFLAALLHDMGKPSCTRLEGGRWVCPHHAPKGAELARCLLWKLAACAGTPEAQTFRETVCLLIRYHTLPPHIGEQEDPHRLIRLAANGELAKDFTISMLCLLSEADLQGRIAADKGRLTEQVEWCRLLAEENGCLSQPKAFASAYTRRAYLAGRLSWPGADLYDNTWGEVILLSGLPGTGKDTWIQAHCPQLPQISLDALRAGMGVPATGHQAPVAHAAQRQARAYLHQRQPFVWNATNLTFPLRGKLVDVFESYGAAVRIVFLETSWEEGLRRNRDRERVVPETTIEKMLDRLDPPQGFEAQHVDWYCV